MPVGYLSGGRWLSAGFLDELLLILFDACMSFVRPLTLAAICSAKRAVIFTIDDWSPGSREIHSGV